ncbi:MAG: TonB-dependent receptor [Hyphomonadaceae bacterium]
MLKFTSRASLLVGASLATLFCTPAPAVAQDVAVEESDALIVTARRREQSVQDVPDSISVFSAATIEAGGLDEVDEFVELTPNAKLTTDSETSSEISVRGSGRNTQDEDPGVGIYRDGVYIGGRLFSTATFYDLQRVEVLRGPQAGLYGRNAVGGALNVITRRPELGEVSGYGEVRVGNLERQEFRGGVNIPLGADAALRVSGLLVNQDEGFDYIVNQDRYTDAGETSSIRGRLLLAPTSNLEFLTTFETIETEGFQRLIMDSPNATTGFLDNDDVLPIPGSPGFTADDTDNQFRDWPTFQNFDQWQFSQEVNWSVDAGTTTAIVSYREASYNLSRDDDYTEFMIGGREYNAEQQSTFAEIRFASEERGGFSYIVGLNYLREDVDLTYNSLNGGDFAGALFGLNLADMYATGVTPPGSEPIWDALFGVPIPDGTPIDVIGLTPGLTGLTGFLGDSAFIRFDNVQSLDSLAVFAEANYELTPQWEVWANGRWTRDEKDIVFGQNFVGGCDACVEVIGAFTGASFEVSGSNSAAFENVSFGGGVNWRPSANIMAYLKAVQGFKAGGFNPISATPELQAFDSETTIGYEAGLKWELFDSRAILNLSAFLQDRTDALVEIDDPNLDINTIGVNAGEIRNQGFEAQLSLLPSEGLRFDLAYGYLDATFEDFVAGGDDFTGNQVPKTYEHSFSAVVTYEQPLVGELGLYSFLSYNNAWGGYTDNDNLVELDNPETIDLAAGIETANRWRIGAFVNNVADNRYVAWQRAPDGTNRRGTFAAGRTYGVQIRGTF